VTVQREGEVDESMAEHRGSVDRRPTAPHDNSSRLIGLAIVTVVTLGLMVGWFWSAVGNGDELAVAPAPAPSAAPAPDPAPVEDGGSAALAPTPVATPPAPGSNQLRSRDWLLSPYAVVSNDGELVITGTLTNLGNDEDSARVRVFVYAQGNPVALATGEVLQVPADTGVEVTLPSGSNWVGGSKVLLLETAPVPPS
jgi:hypothetical protein